MAHINNLDVITDKIYQEGIDRAEKDAKAIITRSEAQAARILEEARSEAHEVLTGAQQEATRIKTSSENELRLKGKQLIADLKAEIHRVLSQQIVENGTRQALADVPFLQSAIKLAISSWNPEDDLELVLPKKLEDEMDQAFYQSIRKQTKDLTITFSDTLTLGFRIREKNNGYQISFSEEDFNLLFSPYLQKQSVQLLFQNP